MVISKILSEPLFLDDAHRIHVDDYCGFLVLNAETLICLNGADVVGVACFSEITLGRCATFFGWIAPEAREGFANQKMMRAFLHEDVIDYAWSTLKLIKLEARCHPDNTAAAALLENAGFRMVGRLAADLVINGNLSDTLLWELVNPMYVIEEALPEKSRQTELYDGEDDEYDEEEDVDGQPEAEDEQLDAVDDDDAEVAEPATSLADNEFAALYGTTSSPSTYGRRSVNARTRHK